MSGESATYFGYKRIVTHTKAGRKYVDATKTAWCIRPKKSLGRGRRSGYPEDKVGGEKGPYETYLQWTGSGQDRHLSVKAEFQCSSEDEALFHTELAAV